MSELNQALCEIGRRLGPDTIRETINGRNKYDTRLLNEMRRHSISGPYYKHEAFVRSLVDMETYRTWRNG